MKRDFHNASRVIFLSGDEYPNLKIGLEAGAFKTDSRDIIFWSFFWVLDF